MLASPVCKRSIEIAGTLTSVSLETPFWDVLKAIADSRNMHLQDLVNEIDSRRQQTNRSSALRLYALAWALRRRATLP